MYRRVPFQLKSVTTSADGRLTDPREVALAAIVPADQREGSREWECDGECGLGAAPRHG